ncbi:SRPBCC family protein [Actinomadura fibrosa]|uniref:SRPBCC family protein n=1 Tax=Actinomadura fibrosa TaxID=111802 RepID=A0ABW2XHM7_9ACTN|nr:SRPBCC family protein [Actinomadura fibrosa]
MPYEIEATATCFAAPEVIFKHLCVAEAWGEWGGFWTRPRRERAGREHPNGIGAIRYIPPWREEVVVYEPPRRYGYVALAGPSRGLRAEITLVPQGSNTLIRWRGVFEGGLPGAGPLTRAVLRRRLNGYARRVAWHSERCEPGCPARLPGIL